MRTDNKALAYAVLRLALGVNICGHGAFRILSGVGAFAHGMVVGMDKGPLPHALSLGFGYCIPWIELVLGALLVMGFLTRMALVAGGLFIVVLTFGTTSIQNWQGAGGQLLYSLAFFVLLWCFDANSISVDTLMQRRRT